MEQSATMTDTTPSNEAINTVDANAEATPQAETQAENQTAAEEAFLTVKYNHEERALKMDEATLFAQKGMKYDDISPMLKDLDFIAAQSGKTAKEFLSELRQADETRYKESLVEKYGDDDEAINALLERYKTERNERYSQAVTKQQESEKTAQESTEQRISKEFVEFQKDFPDIKEFKDLPETVKKDVFNGKDIIGSYLLYQHRQANKIAAAQKTAHAASTASGGSLGSSEKSDGLYEAFRAGLFG